VLASLRFRLRNDVFREALGVADCRIDEFLDGKRTVALIKDSAERDEESRL
jgi:hypothetical protein